VRPGCGVQLCVQVHPKRGVCGRVCYFISLLGQKPTASSDMQTSLALKLLISSLPLSASLYDQARWVPAAALPSPQYTVAMESLEPAASSRLLGWNASERTAPMRCPRNEL